MACSILLHYDSECVAQFASVDEKVFGQGRRIEKIPSVRRDAYFGDWCSTPCMYGHRKKGARVMSDDRGGTYGGGHGGGNQGGGQSGGGNNGGGPQPHSDGPKK